MSDPEREQGLEDYKKSLLELREWEAKLRTLRLGIKDLQREFDVSEENIKALQSVGQIIGEVLKQLDEERCTFSSPFFALFWIWVNSTQLTVYSHCQGILRAPICRRLSFQGRQVQVEARNPCRSGYDNAYYHADAATRSRPHGVQHVSGGCRPDQLCRNWWFERTDQRTTRSD